MVTRPVLSAEVATMLIALFFLVSGLFQFFGSIWVAQPAWGWQAVDGIIAFVLSLLVLAQWPASGLWVIGLFEQVERHLIDRLTVGIDMAERVNMGADVIERGDEVCLKSHRVARYAEIEGFGRLVAAADGDDWPLEKTWAPACCPR